MEVVFHGNLIDFTKALFSDPDSIGVCWSANQFFAANTTAKLRRQCDIKNLLLWLVPFSISNGAPVVGPLAAGADDVQPEHIDKRELAARFHALIGRRRDYAAPVHTFCGCTFDPERGTVRSGPAFVTLTKFEADVLNLLILRGGAVVPKPVMLDHIYQGRDEAKEKIIDVYVSKTRKKLFSVTGGRDVIETVWGRGFRFVKDGFAPKFAKSRRDAG